MSNNEAQAPIAIDLFAGAGGLSEGLLSAGIHVAASVELHPQAGLTHAFNHSDTAVLVGDIRELSYDVLDECLPADATQVDLVAGGPPCQGFSSAGKKAETDPRNSLFRAFADAIEHYQPKMFLMENVTGFRSMYGGAVYDEAKRVFAELGYETTDCVIAAADFGVPQTRKRFVMVGWHLGSDVQFDWPEATHQASAQSSLLDLTLELAPYAGDALGDLAFVEPGFEATRYRSDPESDFARARRNGNDLLFNQLASRHRAKAARMFSLIPPGGSIRDLPEEERSKKRTMVRLHPSQISNTVVSLPDDMLHYAHDRILSVRECARLQTFDDDFVFIGKRTSGFKERRVDVPQYTQVGNAVPPLLGRALGRAILKALGGSMQDLRDLSSRRQRHELVLGSSGYAGYTLAPDAKSEIQLRTVTGDLIELPIYDCDEPVSQQRALIDWKSVPSPRRGQWAPGVIAKESPAWVRQPQKA